MPRKKNIKRKGTYIFSHFLVIFIYLFYTSSRQLFIFTSQPMLMMYYAYLAQGMLYCSTLIIWMEDLENSDFHRNRRIRKLRCLSIILDYIYLQVALPYQFIPIHTRISTAIELPHKVSIVL